MATSSSFFFLKAFFYFLRRIFSRKFRPDLQKTSSFNRTVHRKYQKYPPSLSNQTLIFNVEAALLKSPSPFPYFFLVAFEAGSPLRAMVLLLSYPLVRLVGREMGLKIMVMVSFFGIKKEGFRAGRAVLAKVFLNDVGLEGFEVLRRGGKRVGVSEFPQVMVESFLREYLEIEVVVGRELKVFCGYFVGVMEEDKRKSCHFLDDLGEFHDQGQEGNLQKNTNIIGITSYQRAYDFHFLSSICNEIYLLNEAEKKKWRILPIENYPKPLIFHDGRLALFPTPLNAIALFMWLPLGFPLAVFRAFISITLPYSFCIPISAFTGLRLTVSIPTNPNPKKTALYVCNHRTLLDPVYISAALRKKTAAVTYSLSKVSEFISPIRTVRLSRNRDRDAETMQKLLSASDLIVCPEGTTCREPYLLRFSPLFAEIAGKIVPVANQTAVSMFHGTTAGGLKCLDPVFFLMNPSPAYVVKMLEVVFGSVGGGEQRRFDVANRVQSEIANALNFRCTKLTRRDKYLMLAGNEGVVKEKDSF